MPVRLAVLLCTLLMIACSSAAVQVKPVAMAELSARDDVWRIHFIDIGQGLSVLLEFPCAAMLIDTGGELDEKFNSDDALFSYLNAFFDRRVDLKRTFALVALTHPHVDHTRGVGMVTKNFKISNIIDNGMNQGSGGTQQGELQDFARSHAAATRYRAIYLADIVTPEGLTDDVIDPIRCPKIDPQIHALWGQVANDPGWPGFRFNKTPFQNANNHSVVLRVDYGKSSALFTGDLEEPAIKDLLARSVNSKILDVDVYQVGHHGSSNGTTPELVAAMSPQIAVFSMGPPEWRMQWSGWKFGHPRQEIVAMLEAGIARKRPPLDVQVGIASEKFEPHRVEKALFGTGWDGSVVVEADAEGNMRVVTAGRAPEQRAWKAPPKLRAGERLPGVPSPTDDDGHGK